MKKHSAKKTTPRQSKPQLNRGSTAESGHDAEQTKSGVTTFLPDEPLQTDHPFTKEEHKKLHELLFALQKVSRVLTAEVEIQNILGDMATEVAKTMGAKWVNFWELTPDKNAVYISAHYGMEPEYMEYSHKQPIRLGTAWIGRAVQTGKAWGTSDILSDSKLLKELGIKWKKAIKQQDYRALLCVPLISGQTTIGGMCAYFPKIHTFTDFEMRLMTVAANQAATAITNARIFSELAAERNKTLAIVNSLYDGLIAYDPEDKIIGFNPRAEELLWTKRSIVIGNIPSRLPVREHPFLENIVRISSLDLKEFESRELVVVTPQKIVLQVTLLPLRDAQKQKIGSMRVLHDTTKEKEAEEMKSSFISVASHQLRTPLSGIKWALSILLSEEHGPLSQEQRNILVKTDTANDHLIALVNDLLDVSRIAEGRFGYTFQKINLGELVKTVIEEAAPQLNNKKGISFSFEMPDKELPFISADSKKLPVAIFNILENAIKYTPKGFIKITFREEPAVLTCVVEDSGIGIPADQQKFVFRKFFRGRNAIRLQTEGSGLGLWIANEIIEHHNGKISFTSEEGKGSVFSLQFPTNPALMPKGKLKGT